jgi:hypothetical protein
MKKSVFVSTGNRSKYFSILAGLIFVGIGHAQAFSFFGPSDDEKKIVSSKCEEFISREMPGAVQTHVFDVYKKKGKLVAEVGYRKNEFGIGSGSGAYSVRLCIVDLEKGTLSSPSPLNDSEWRK